jgi:sortase B
MNKWKMAGCQKAGYQKLVTLLCMGVFVYCAVSWVSLFTSYYDNRKVSEEAQEVYVNSVEERSSEPGKVRSQFTALIETNPDVVGWLKIEDTLVNYPILQAADNDYYLKRNYKREETRAGSIFKDFRNRYQTQDDSDPNTDHNPSNLHTIVYGHDMKDGSMFGSLKKYLNRDFFDTHRTLSYDTLYESFDAEIFAVYYTTTEFNYIQTEFANDETYSSFLQNVREKSFYKTDTVLASTDRILTLSTCDYTLDAEEGRLVIQARLVKRERAGEQHSY